MKARLQQSCVAVLWFVLAGVAGCVERPSGSWSEQAGVRVLHDPLTDRTHQLVVDVFPPRLPRSAVYFDRDSSALSDRAHQSLRQFIEELASFPTAPVQLTGHADSSGGSDHNQTLSERRAGAVAAELVRLGVDADRIRILAVGEAGLLLPTPDDVQAPQNRWVELIAREPGNDSTKGAL